MRLSNRTTLLSLIILSSLFSVSCGRHDLKKQMNQMVGAEIVFPHLHDVFLNGKDSVIHMSKDAAARMIVLFDSTFCASCHMPEMSEWNEIIHFAEGTRYRFEPVFIFSPGHEKVPELKRILVANPFEWPMFIDSAEEFIHLNEKVIPTDRRFHVFLLDKNNRVVLVGNPLGNEPLWALYREQIRTLVNER